jgi:5-deoxy-glucuronate isomerase
VGNRNEQSMPEEGIVSTPSSSNTNLVFRKTNAQTGRTISVSPENSAMAHLAYGRIILNSATPKVKFETGDRETGLICLSGEADVTVAGTPVHLSKYDAMYIPRDSTVEVATPSGVDLAEFSADVSQRYPLQVVRYSDVAADPGLRFETGGPTSKRCLNMLLAKNIQAGRLVAGLTHSEPGNWTSWPPHEHSRLLEELYVYVDMPHPAFAIQLVYENLEDPGIATVVREGDAVLMPGGYHPNVSIPGHPIGFLWAMAAHREVEDRLFGVVNVQPDFDTGSTGLEKGRKQ